MRSLVTALLVVCVLAAESIAAVHALDRDAHSGNDTCKLCVSAAAFAGAAPVHVSSAVATASVSDLSVHAPRVAAPLTLFLRPPSRGPPLLP